MEKKLKTEKSGFRLPVRVFVFYFAVVSLLMIGVTFSKYITTTTATSSNTVSLFGHLELYENEADKTQSEFSFQITPGVNLHKQAYVDYSTSQDMDAYVFVKVSTSGWKYTMTSGVYAARVTRESSTVDVVSWSLDIQNSNPSKWKFLKYEPDASGAYSIVCYREVEKGSELKKVPVFKNLPDDENNQIKVSEEITKDDMRTLEKQIKPIEIKAYAVQKEGFSTAEEAWNAVKDK